MKLALILSAIEPNIGGVIIMGHQIDFYAAEDLNLVLHTPFTPTGLPAVNTTFTIRGTMGDHPDQDINVFRSSGDVDLYRINLRAGQRSTAQAPDPEEAAA